VQLIRTEIIKTASVCFVQLRLDLLSPKKIDWEKSKRLLNGSLLVLTADFFQTVYFAVVSFRNCKNSNFKGFNSQNSDTPLLENGTLGITWEGHSPNMNSVEKFLMIESEVFFEAYRQVFPVFLNFFLSYVDVGFV